VWGSDAKLSGIVYLSCHGQGSPSLETLFYSFGQLLGQPHEGQLLDCWRESKLAIADKANLLLGKLREGRYLLVLDNLERALDDEGRALDDSLRVFLELCLTGAHGLRILAASRRRISLVGATARGARCLALDEGLPEAEAISLLREFDPTGTIGLRQADPKQLRELVSRCYAIPKALEGAAGILSDDPTLSLEKLLADSASFGRQVVEELVAEHYLRLSENDRRVIQGLAVFDSPVPDDAVKHVVSTTSPEADVDDSLRRLVLSHAVIYRRSQGTYELHPIDRHHAYADIPDEDDSWSKEACHLRAAEYYRQCGRPKDEWKTMEDVRPQLREFEHLYRAGRFDEACTVLSQIDYDCLHRWGLYRLTERLRSKCLGKLTDKKLEAENLTALAHIIHED